MYIAETYGSKSYEAEVDQMTRLPWDTFRHARFEMNCGWSLLYQKLIGKCPRHAD